MLEEQKRKEVSSSEEEPEGLRPTFVQRPKKKTVKESSTTEFKACFVANPKPTVKWYFEDTEIIETERVKVSLYQDVHMYTSVMRIEHVTEQDTGKYTIVVENEFATIEAIAPLTLIEELPKGEAPYFTTVLPSLIVREGQDTIMECTVAGNPHPEISILKKDTEIIVTDKYSIDVVEDGSVSFTIRNVALEDGSSYTCKATNQFGTASCTAELLVEQIKEAPTLVQPLRDQRIVQDQDVKFTSKIHGIPKPLVTWYRNEEEIVLTDKVRVSEEDDTQVLEISKCTSDDVGYYSLTASNPAGEVTTVAHLEVVQ